MPSIGTHIIDIVESLLADDEECGRILISEVPDFIQEEIFKVLNDKILDGKVNFVFTNVDAESIESLHVVGKREEILTLRNNYSIKKLVIISDISLDRSNESALNDPSKVEGGPWLWIRSDFGTKLLTKLITEVIDSIEIYSRVQEMLEHIGEHYENGINLQWRFMENLSYAPEYTGYNPIDVLSYLVGLPRQVDEKIETAITMLDSRISMRPSFVGDSIDIMLGNLGLNGFRLHVEEFIKGISTNTDEAAFNLLKQELKDNGAKISSNQELSDMYLVAFDDFFIRLTSRSIELNEICGSIINYFFTPERFNRRIPEYWSILTVNFWHSILGVTRVKSKTIVVNILDEIMWLNNPSNEFSVVSSPKGEIGLKVENWQELGDLVVNNGIEIREFADGDVNIKLESADLEKPIRLLVSSLSITRTCKVLPIEYCKSGVILSVGREGRVCTQIYDLDRDVWVHNIEIGSVGQVKIFILVRNGFKIADVLDEEQDELYEHTRSADLSADTYSCYESYVWTDFEESEKKISFKVSYELEEFVRHELIINVRLRVKEQSESYYQRIVKEHLYRRPIGSVSIEIRNVFVDQFESWIVKNEEFSHCPVGIGVKDIEGMNISGFRSGRDLNFGYDISKYAKINTGHLFPANLVTIRAKLIKYLCQSGPSRKENPFLLRHVDLTRPDKVVSTLISEYLSEYVKALQHDRDSNMWFDVHPVIDDKGKSRELIMSTDIAGLLVSPFHPLRLYWQYRVQSLLEESKKNEDEIFRYCPAASAFDPSIVPDVLCVTLKANTGTLQASSFVSMTNNSNYWGFLMSPSFALFAGSDSFWTKLGFTVEGINQGLFKSQIERSLKDVSRIMASKDKLKVTIQGDSGGYEEEGILSWLRCVNNAGDIEKTERRNYSEDIAWGTLRGRKLEVYDKRPVECQPNEYMLYEHYSSLRKAISWFDAITNPISDQLTDLSIICNVGVSRLSVESAKMPASPSIGPLLYKQRFVRVINDHNQMPMQEQRSTLTSGIKSYKSDKDFLSAVAILEHSDQDSKTVIAVTARVDLLRQAIQNSHLSVVSSSILTPATFSLLSKSSQDEEFYLWDFDLPSFNSTSNTKNGYFLLAHPKVGQQTSAIRISLENYLLLFESYKVKSTGERKKTVRELLLEYISKGLPALKKLIYGGNAFRGELGNLVALRLLQGRDFQAGIIPILEIEENFKILNLVIPIDPFQEVIERMPREEGDDRSRPDFLIISFKTSEDSFSLKITPLEVKFRTGLDSSWRAHLGQANKFIKFLKRIVALAGKYEVWRVAYVSIIGRMIEYSLHVASGVISNEEVLSTVQNLGFELITRIFRGDGDPDLQIAAEGRLIYINADRTVSEQSVADASTAYLNWKLCEDLLFSGVEANSFCNGELVMLTNGWGLRPMFEAQANVKEVISTVEKVPVGIEIPVDFVPTVPLLGVFDINSYLTTYPKGVNIKIGRSDNIIGSKEFYYNPGSTDVNQLNIGVIGDLGTGKTQLLKALVYNMSISEAENRGKTPKFLILDTKRDYDGSGSLLDKIFLEKINAKVVLPTKIPLNLFDIRGSDEFNAALNRAKFFIDVLNRIYGGIGPVQKDTLLNSIMEAYHMRGYTNGSEFDRSNFISPTLQDVRDIYRSKVKQTDVPLSIMNALIMEDLFENDSTKTSSFVSFFDSSVVVALGRIANSIDSLKLAMIIFLKLYQEYMLSVVKEPYLGTNPGLRKIESYVLIDEAKLIMDYELQVLEDLLRKGREFGIGVILSSQYLSDFTTSKTDYKQPLSTWFIHKVPDVSVKDLRSIGIVSADDNLVSNIKNLKKHYCIYKTVDVDGKLVRGTPLFEILQD
jgi:DNA phosphorothioation-dependent restriction protein DptH